jgi:hypothetical protein
MTERITASVLEPYSTDVAIWYEDYGTEIAQLQRTVMEYLTYHGLNPSDVLFAGYTEAVPKSEGSEHWEEGASPQFFFGDIGSLAPPDTLSDNPDIQEEHWAVNPLNYAITQGTLGFFDKEKLGKPTETDQDFGTYLYEISPETVEAAQVAGLSIRRPETAVDVNA